MGLRVSSSLLNPDDKSSWSLDNAQNSPSYVNGKVRQSDARQLAWPSTLVKAVDLNVSSAVPASRTTDHPLSTALVGSIRCFPLGASLVVQRRMGTHPAANVAEKHF
jgi:hypothetical protein